MAYSWSNPPDHTTQIQALAFQNTFLAAFRERLSILGTNEAEVAQSTTPPADLAPITFTPPASNLDPDRKGSWYGTAGQQLGFDGHALPVGGQSLPAYVTAFSVGGAPALTWDAVPTDPRALQAPGGASRVAACWHAATITLTLTIATTPDDRTRYVSLYFVDYDKAGRSLSLSGPAFNSFPAFSGGVWLTLRLTAGSYTLNVAHAAGPDAVLSGVLFDTAGDSIQYVGQSQGSAAINQPWARVGSMQAWILSNLTNFADPAIDPTTITTARTKPSGFSRLATLQDWCFTDPGFFTKAGVLAEPGTTDPTNAATYDPAARFRRLKPRAVYDLLDSYSPAGAAIDTDGNALADGMRAYVLAAGVPSTPAGRYPTGSSGPAFTGHFPSGGTVTATANPLAFTVTATNDSGTVFTNSPLAWDGGSGVTALGMVGVWTRGAIYWGDGSVWPTQTAGRVSTVGQYSNEVHVRRAGAWLPLRSLPAADAGQGPVDVLDAARAAPNHCRAGIMRSTGGVDSDYVGWWLWADVRACFNLMLVTTPEAFIYTPGVGDDVPNDVLNGVTTANLQRLITSIGLAPDNASRASAIASLQAQMAAGGNSAYPFNGLAGFVNPYWAVFTETDTDGFGRWAVGCAVSYGAVPLVPNLGTRIAGTITFLAYPFVPNTGTFDAQGTPLVAAGRWNVVQTINKPAYARDVPQTAVTGSVLWAANTTPPNFANPDPSTSAFVTIGFIASFFRGYCDWRPGLTYKP